jgi:ribosomal protein L32
VTGTIVKDVGRQAASDFLRRIPLFGDAVADNVAGEDPRYVYSLTPQQLAAAWKQCEKYFRECPTCGQIVCISDFDEQSGFCREDSPRRGEIAQAEAEQVAGVAKGLAAAFGFGDVIKNAAEAAKRASTTLASCPKDGTVAAAGTKFCPECGSPMVQPQAPVVDKCQNCGAEVHGAKFCPECGTKIERPAAPPASCPSCGAATQGAKFCPECGTKLV